MYFSLRLLFQKIINYLQIKVHISGSLLMSEVSILYLWLRCHPAHEVNGQ